MEARSGKAGGTRNWATALPGKTLAGPTCDRSPQSGEQARCTQQFGATPDLDRSFMEELAGQMDALRDVLDASLDTCGGEIIATRDKLIIMILGPGRGRCGRGRAEVRRLAPP